MPRNNLPIEQTPRCQQRRLLVAVFLFCLGALPLTPLAAGQGQPEYADEWLARPVDDATFAAYLEAFAYDPDVAFETQVREQIVDGISTTHLRFQSTPGVQVFARLYRAAEATPETPTLIVLHGGATRGKDSGAVGSLAQLFVGHGFNVFAMDLMYFGERSTGLLGRISPTPLLMINGERDAAFPKSSSVLPLQRLANPPKVLHWSDSVHGELAKGDAQLLVDWLRQHLMSSAHP